MIELLKKYKVILHPTYHSREGGNPDLPLFSSDDSLDLCLRRDDTRKAVIKNKGTGTSSLLRLALVSGEILKTSLNALNYRYMIYRLFFLLLIAVSLYGFFPFFSFKSYHAKTHTSQDYIFKKKYKIQIIPVQDFIGDMQAAKNLCISSNNLGLECQIFARKRGQDIWIKNKLYELIHNCIVFWTKPDLILET